MVETHTSRYVFQINLPDPFGEKCCDELCMRDSPVIGCSLGSTQTSLQTSVRRKANSLYCPTFTLCGQMYVPTYCSLSQTWSHGIARLYYVALQAGA